jgi:hypothetical protein
MAASRFAVQLDLGDFRRYSQTTPDLCCPAMGFTFAVGCHPASRDTCLVDIGQRVLL